MRILIQRVFEAWVKVQGVQYSRTSNGLLVLIGLTHNDTKDVADYMITKILNMKLWEKDGKNWNGSVKDIQGDIMLVSQFTLYAILKGHKPDFHSSMEAQKARQLFEYTTEGLKKNYVAQRIKTGKFQALMQVGSVINGPVTIQYEKSAQDIQKTLKKKPEQTNKKINNKKVEQKIEKEPTMQKKQEQEERNDKKQI